MSQCRGAYVNKQHGKINFYSLFFLVPFRHSGFVCSYFYATMTVLLIFISISLFSLLNILFLAMGEVLNLYHLDRLSDCLKLHALHFLHDAVKTINYILRSICRGLSGAKKYSYDIRFITSLID